MINQTDLKEHYPFRHGKQQEAAKLKVTATKCGHPAWSTIAWSCRQPQSTGRRCVVAAFD
jgi:hypothetical protein